jgi:hypothetical protein
MTYRDDDDRTRDRACVQEYSTDAARSASRRSLVPPLLLARRVAPLRVPKRLTF